MGPDNCTMGLFRSGVQVNRVIGNHFQFLVSCMNLVGRKKGNNGRQYSCEMHPPLPDVARGAAVI